VLQKDSAQDLGVEHILQNAWTGEWIADLCGAALLHPSCHHHHTPDDNLLLAADACCRRHKSLLVSLHFCKLALMFCFFIALSSRSQHRPLKQVQAATSSMLSDAAMMQQVFSFLPPGNWLIQLVLLCREWQAVYAHQAEQQVYSFSIDYAPKLVACCSRTTLYSAAVASPAMARLAHSCGLAICKNDKLEAIAGRYADLDTLAALRELGMPLDATVSHAAALSGRLHILQHLSSKQGPMYTISNGVDHYAGRSGSIDMLNWLRSQAWWYDVDDENACAGAAEAGHLTLLQHLINEGCKWDGESLIQDAASSGSMELVEWLRVEQHITLNADALTAAAGAGQIGMCEYLLREGCELNFEACSRAAAGGHTDTLRWLLEQECPWSVHEVCMSAARNGYTDILDFVIEQGEVLDAELLTDALNDAGSSNQLPAVQWLRQHGAAWPAALGFGQRYFHQWGGESLAWARAQGCTASINP
jgi:hypothetical protein